jgi:hypothetical protein
MAAALKNLELPHGKYLPFSLKFCHPADMINLEDTLLWPPKKNRLFVYIG